MPTELPADALEMALWVRQRADRPVDGLIVHSDIEYVGGGLWAV